MEHRTQSTIFSVEMPTNKNDLHLKYKGHRCNSTENVQIDRKLPSQWTHYNLSAIDSEHLIRTITFYFNSNIVLQHMCYLTSRFRK